MASRPESERPVVPDPDTREATGAFAERLTFLLRALLVDRELHEQLRRSREAMQRGEPPIPFKDVQREAAAKHGGTGL